MQNFDISHLPQPVHDAVLHVLETLVQAFPLAPAEAVRGDLPAAARPSRFPRSATELLVLETLEALAPMPATPQQVATMIHKTRTEVQAILASLETLGTITRPAKGLYRPSARFAAQIAALYAPHTKE